MKRMVKLRVLPEQTVKMSVAGEIVKTGEPVILPKHITQNGQYWASQENANGYNPVVVDVDMQPAYRQGKEDGQKAQYDSFWDVYQNYGSRIRYHNAFDEVGWTTENFKPKYSFNYSYNIFDRSCIEGSLPEICKEQGIEFIDNGGYHSGGFVNTLFTEIHLLPRPASVHVSTFSGSEKLKTVKIASAESTEYRSGVFQGCTALENLTIVGTIGKNGFSVEDSTRLTRESIANIVNSLSAAATGLTVTISQTAKENAFTPEEWAALIAAKPNWTIALA